MKNKKKVLILALILAIAMPLNVFAYSDVTSEHWAFDKVEALSSLGIFSELASGAEFMPTKPITREEFFTVVIKGIYGVQTAVTETPFADKGSVSPVMMPYISKAYDQKILMGTEKGGLLYISPKSNITRQEGAAILARALDITSTETLEYRDAGAIAAYAYPRIAGLKETGIMTGYASDNTFKPKNNITRAESASMIFETIERNKLAKFAVSTYAGNGNFGDKDGKAGEVGFYMPTGIANDSAGNLFVMDTASNLIRKISKEMEVTKVSGTVEIRDFYNIAIGSFKDGDNATAYFKEPTFGVVNSKGEVLVADSKNHMIRIVGSAKTSTLVGNKVAGYAEGRALAARFNEPSAIAIDSKGNIYVADTGNHCIRVLDSKGNTKLLAGTPEKSGYKDGSATSAMFNEPMGIAVCHDGTVYVSDTGNQRIRAIDIDGNVTTLAGGGTDILAETDYIFGDYLDAKGSAARFNFPMGICIVNDEYIVVADSKNHVIRMVSLDGQVRTIAGSGDNGLENGSAFNARFNEPTDVTYMDGNIYIADRQNNVIRKLTR